MDKSDIGFIIVILIIVGAFAFAIRAAIKSTQRKVNACSQLSLENLSDKGKEAFRTLCIER